MKILTRSDAPSVYGRLFETAVHRRAQRETMLECLKAWGGCDALDMGAGSPIDYVIVREGGPDPLALADVRHPLGHVEIKRRAVKHSTYPTIWIETSKRKALVEASRSMGGTPRFIVHYDDGIYWIDMEDTAGLPIVVGGREDRGLREDMDRCVDVPVTLLKGL